MIDDPGSKFKEDHSRQKAVINDMHLIPAHPHTHPGHVHGGCMNRSCFEPVASCNHVLICLVNQFCISGGRIKEFNTGRNVADSIRRIHSLHVCEQLFVAPAACTGAGWLACAPECARRAHGTYTPNYAHRTEKLPQKREVRANLSARTFIYPIAAAITTTRTHTSSSGTVSPKSTSIFRENGGRFPSRLECNLRG